MTVEVFLEFGAFRLQWRIVYYVLLLSVLSYHVLTSRVFYNHFCSGRVLSQFFQFLNTT